jgi:Protein of unknown function (DUF3455)
MFYDPKERVRPSSVSRRLVAIASVLGCALCTVASAAAQKAAFPVTPEAITPEVGNSAYLEAHAIGSQGYICLPTTTGTNSWTVNPARPEATLFIDILGHPVQIITHFASIDTHPNDFAKKPVSLGGNATWQSSFDTSRVWAVQTGKVDPGTSDICPNKDSIPCLRLQSIGNQEGPLGGGILAKATFVQRINTKGGAAPTTACTVGQTQLQPYTADYIFFRADE